jgi:hypothetical protein
LPVQLFYPSTTSGFGLNEAILIFIFREWSLPANTAQPKSRHEKQTECEKKREKTGAIRVQPRGSTGLPVNHLHLQDSEIQIWDGF